MGEDCNCEEDFPEPDGEEPYLFTRTCTLCGCTWGSGHCPHDGVQNGCPDCGWLPPGAVTPAQALGFEPPVPA